MLRVAHCFARCEHTHKAHILLHLTHRVSERDGDGERQPFWNGDDQHCDRDDEERNDFAPLVRSPAVVVAAVAVRVRSDEKSNNQAHEAQHSHDTSDAANRPRKFLKLPRQNRVLVVFRRLVAFSFDFSVRLLNNLLEFNNVAIVARGTFKGSGSVPKLVCRVLLRLAFGLELCNLSIHLGDLLIVPFRDCDLLDGALPLNSLGQFIHLRFQFSGVPSGRPDQSLIFVIRHEVRTEAVVHVQCPFNLTLPLSLRCTGASDARSQSTIRVVETHGDDYHPALACAHRCPRQHEGPRLGVLNLDIRFAGQRGLVNSYRCVSLKEYAIGLDHLAVLHVHDIAHHKFIRVDRDGCKISFSKHRHLCALLRLGLECPELLLLLVVVECRDVDDNKDGDKDGSPFDPRRVDVIFICGGRLENK
mmetsp:Transcript_840/g.2473  ORF Transcript_840/g.2473 Transcript_840/m.2473 type:complete len:417 (-) Transcript_840:388-1638(-)